MAVAAMFTAFLAGIAVAFKNCFSPFFKFLVSTSEAVGVRLIDVISKALCLASLAASATFRGGYQTLGAGWTALTQHAALAVFWHRSLAKRAWDHDAHTGSAHLVPIREVMRALTTDFALNANPAVASCKTSSTGSAGGTLGWFTQSRDGCHRRTTFRTRSKSCSIATVADSIITTVDVANFTSVFSHIASIPKLPKGGQV